MNPESSWHGVSIWERRVCRRLPHFFTYGWSYTLGGLHEEPWDDGAQPLRPSQMLQILNLDWGWRDGQVAHCPSALAGLPEPQDGCVLCGLTVCALTSGLPCLCPAHLSLNGKRLLQWTIAFCPLNWSFSFFGLFKQFLVSRHLLAFLGKDLDLEKSPGIQTPL